MRVKVDDFIDESKIKDLNVVRKLRYFAKYLKSWDPKS